MQSIFDVFKDFYGKSVPYGQQQIPKLFVKYRIRKDLNVSQRMMVFQLMMAIENATDIEPVNILDEFHNLIF